MNKSKQIEPVAILVLVGFNLEAGLFSCLCRFELDSSLFHIGILSPHLFGDLRGVVFRGRVHVVPQALLKPLCVLSLHVMYGHLQGGGRWCQWHEHSWNRRDAPSSPHLDEVIRFWRVQFCRLELPCPALPLGSMDSAVVHVLLLALRCPLGIQRPCAFARLREHVVRQLASLVLCG